ncbi:MAG TPA: hypothetical protein DEH25_16760 [Chloroflexi bacterium]|nr:hypothetical protein [Chloroflexota bacterium]HBY07267.1 hypothetical protein [Chloroflexota bacterium]
MTTAEERLKILKMIQDGRITAEEGAKLLKALTASGQKPRRPPASRTAGAARWLRVRVTDMSTGKAKVNVNLPLKLVDAGLNIAAQFAPEDIDVAGLMDAVNDAISDNLIGKIVDVVDGEDGEHIEVFIE